MKKENYIKPEIRIISAGPMMPLAESFPSPDKDNNEEEDADDAAAKPTLPVSDIWDEDFY